MMIIGNDELHGVKVKKGDIVYKGNLRGKVEWMKEEGSSAEYGLLGAITTEEGKSYLVAIRGHLLDGWSIEDKQVEELKAEIRLLETRIWELEKELGGKS